MRLKRYLWIVYLLTFGGLLVAATAMYGRQGFVGAVRPALVIALANTFINVWPWARMVPEEKRTSYRAYRWTNVFMAIWLSGVALLVVLQVGTALVS